MSVVPCPACGEAEELRGTTAGDEIEVECLACGHRWTRGALRCRSCAGEASVELPQQMTRHPRGTLLAVTGRRRVRLCPSCDAEVVREGRDTRRPVPEQYVSRFVYGDPRERALERPAPPPTPAVREPRPPRTPAPAVPRRREPGPEPAPEPTGPKDPTVRQATEAFLEQADAADPITLVLWGQEVGANTRLSRLDAPEHDHRPEVWLECTFGAQSEQRRAVARATLAAAFAHWRESGWLGQDLADRLR